MQHQTQLVSVMRPESHREADKLCYAEPDKEKPISQTSVGVSDDAGDPALGKFTLPREMECTKNALFPNTLPWKRPQCKFLFPPSPGVKTDITYQRSGFAKCFLQARKG